MKFMKSIIMICLMCGVVTLKSYNLKTSITDEIKNSI